MSTSYSDRDQQVAAAFIDDLKQAQSGSAPWSQLHLIDIVAQELRSEGEAVTGFDRRMLNACHEVLAIGVASHQTLAGELRHFQSWLESPEQEYVLTLASKRSLERVRSNGGLSVGAGPSDLAKTMFARLISVIGNQNRFTSDSARLPRKRLSDLAQNARLQSGDEGAQVLALAIEHTLESLDDVASNEPEPLGEGRRFRSYHRVGALGRLQGWASDALEAAEMNRWPLPLCVDVATEVDGTVLKSGAQKAQFCVARLAAAWQSQPPKDLDPEKIFGSNAAVALQELQKVEQRCVDVLLLNGPSASFGPDDNFWIRRLHKAWSDWIPNKPRLTSGDQDFDKNNALHDLPEATPAYGGSVERLRSSAVAAMDAIRAVEPSLVPSRSHSAVRTL